MLYDKPVRELLRDFVRERPLRTGEIIPKADIVRWFEAHYPRIKASTVAAQTTLATTNPKARVYYHAEPRHDIFFQTDSSHIRLYDPASDPAPIYFSSSLENGTRPTGQEPDEDDESAPEGNEFAYESDLKNYLSANLGLIERGLRLYQHPDGLSGLEFPVGGRFVDILAVDIRGDFGCRRTEGVSGLRPCCRSAYAVYGMGRG